MFAIQIQQSALQKTDIIKRSPPPLHHLKNNIVPSRVVDRKPRLFQRPKAATITIDLIESSYFIGKGIILFTMFYCTMNWWFYKRTREDIEKK